MLSRPEEPPASGSSRKTPVGFLAASRTRFGGTQHPRRADALSHCQFAYIRGVRRSGAASYADPSVLRMRRRYLRTSHTSNPLLRRVTVPGSGTAASVRLPSDTSQPCVQFVGLARLKQSKWEFTTATEQIINAALKRCRVAGRCMPKTRHAGYSRPDSELNVLDARCLQFFSWLTLWKRAPVSNTKGNPAIQNCLEGRTERQAHSRHLIVTASRAGLHSTK